MYLYLQAACTNQVLVLHIMRTHVGLLDHSLNSRCSLGFINWPGWWLSLLNSQSDTSDVKVYDNSYQAM